ncbi:MAG: divergent PAP2 family protein [Spirochaetaceae bacterium]|nr:divergent PAP2 family protein [Spirochaetaceae bacterium]
MKTYIIARYIYLFVPFISWAAAQLLKPFFNYLIHRKWNYKMFWQSSGMPSSHSSTVMSLATIIGLREGLSSPFFAIAITFALIIMYDARGVRQASGKHASYLNSIMDDVNNLLNKGISYERFKTELGHSTNQVAAGGVLGFLIALLFYNIIG